MNAKEIREVDGGCWNYVFAAALYIASEWDDFSRGVQDGMNDSYQY